jgi:DNA invertase Pin-like site-specific DNA recombinase
MCTQFFIQRGQVLVKWPHKRRKRWSTRRLPQEKAQAILDAAFQNFQEKGTYSYNKVGKEFKVSPMTVHQIVNKRTWRELQPLVVTGENQ